MGACREKQAGMEPSRYVDEPEVEWSASGHACSECGETIQYCDEVFCMMVSFAVSSQIGITYQPALHDDGDYRYEPCFFCFQCGEALIEEVRERVRDVPAGNDANAITACHICDSAICHGEILGVLVHGEIHATRRQPDTNIYGGDTFVFMDDNPTRFCLDCINVATETTNLWQDGVRVTQHLECAEGSSTRCWRRGCPADGSCNND